MLMPKRYEERGRGLDVAIIKPISNSKELSGWAPIPPVSQKVTYSNPVNTTTLSRGSNVS